MELGAGRWARGRVAGAGRAWARERALQAVGRAGSGRSGRAEQARGGAAAGSRGRAVGAGRGARGGRLGGQCAPGCAQLGQVRVLCTLTQFLAWFDSVLFLSH